MSRPNDFDRLDNAAGQPPPDRFERFKAGMNDLLAYREAYHRAKTADPNSVEGLPDPDGAAEFDVKEAMARLQSGGGGPGQALRGVPPREVRG